MVFDNQGERGYFWLGVCTVSILSMLSVISVIVTSIVQKYSPGVGCTLLVYNYRSLQF